ncbi:MAG: DUF362 domain-containing protein [Eubacteriales bacterium]|nr:DUF362 domain-containing protein [Eubacteriales bacterium]MDD3881175.1 DUF362 domain-containing protein [Eubacteriales bacterium]MDD4511557.1 DUF362 domain-containing protein [Eubacteriales bacterium]
MEKAKVYMTSLRTEVDESRLDKLRRLIDKAGLGTVDMKGKFVAIKMHFGERGNLSFLRPNYAKCVADYVKSKGGIPFLTDCNTLYTGSRKYAPEHMDTAMENGFSPLSTGCQIIIADGLKGTDEALVPVKGDYVTVAKVGRALMDADMIITLSHFKGHEATGFGGAIKNIGMGGGSGEGKREMHSAGKPHVIKDKCVGCGRCKKECAHGAITIEDKKAGIAHNVCAGCGRCVGVCPMGAIERTDDCALEILDKKIAEYALAILQNRPQFHVSLVMDVSPKCDCHSGNDVPLIPDVGMFASFDSVAVDKACADACMAAPAMPDSAYAETGKHGDPFTAVHPETAWRVQLEHGEKLGLGTQDYELVLVK